MAAHGVRRTPYGMAELLPILFRFDDEPFVAGFVNFRLFRQPIEGGVAKNKPAKVVKTAKPKVAKPKAGA